jgi:hypothetical protein
MKAISTIPRSWNGREASGVDSTASSPRKLGFGWEIGMEHDLVLMRNDGSTRHFRIYGRSAPNVGDIVTLPIDGQLIEARVAEIHGEASSRAEASPRAEMVQPVDHIDAAEFEEV